LPEQLTFSEIDLVDEDRVKQFFEQFPASDSFWSTVETRRFRKELLNGLMQKREIFAANEGGKICGLIWAQKRAWDSHHFGVMVAHVNGLIAQGNYLTSRSTKKFLLAQWLQYPTTSNLNYLVIRLGADDLSGLHAAEATGFQVLAPMVTLLRISKRQHQRLGPQLDYQFTPYRPEDLVELKAIAGECFTHSRFHQEDGWARTKSDELHVKWIENCCLAGLADIVIVARKNGRPLGFITCKIDKSPFDSPERVTGQIVLLGVSTAAQRRGIGTQLVLEAVQWFGDAVDAIEVRTEAYNYASIRSYQKAGFQIIDHSLYYRQWLKATTRPVSHR